MEDPSREAAMTIRTATKADIPTIQQLFLQADKHHARLIPDVFRAVENARPNRLIEGSIGVSDAQVFLAVLEGETVGFLEVKEGARPDYPMFIPRSLAVVENMVVDEAHRGRGIGSTLLEAARTWAVERGLEAMHLTVWSENTDAVRLYERHGYRRLLERMEMDL